MSGCAGVDEAAIVGCDLVAMVAVAVVVVVVSDGSGGRGDSSKRQPTNRPRLCSVQPRMKLMNKFMSRLKHNRKKKLSYIYLFVQNL